MRGIYMEHITKNDKQLTTAEQTIYTKIVKYNKENKSINKTISKLLETGKSRAKTRADKDKNRGYVDQTVSIWVVTHRLNT